jgi:hypothetical protein
VPPPPPRPAVEKRDALLLAAAYHVRHRHKLSFPAILARVTTEGMRGRVRVEPLSGPAWNPTRLQIEGCSRAGTARRTPPAWRESLVLQVTVEVDGQNRAAVVEPGDHRGAHVVASRGPLPRMTSTVSPTTRASVCRTGRCLPASASVNRIPNRAFRRKHPSERRSSARCKARESQR